MNIKVLLVDDEKLERILIRKGFPWEKNGFEIIGEVESGVEAIEFVKYRKPDVVFTDISMPHMNGLELAEQIRVIHPKCFIVIITGFREFEYAQRALKIGVEDFLLKPVSMDDIFQITLKIKGKIEKEKERNQEVENLKNNITANQDIVMESFFQRLVENRISQEEAKQRLNAYGCSQLAQQSCCVNINLKNEKQLVIHQKKVLDAIANKELIGTICFLHYMNNVIVFFIEHQMDTIIQIAKELKSELDELGIPAIIGVSNVHTTFNGIQTSFCESERAISMAVLFENDQVIRYEKYAQIIKEVQEIELFKWEEFDFLLTNGLQEKVYKYMEDYIKIFSTDKFQKSDYLRLITLEILNRGKATLARYGENASNVIDKEEFNSEIKKISSLEESKNMIHKYIDIVQKFHLTRKPKQGNKVVKEALKCIEKNLCNQELSLKFVATQIYSNDSYLSRVFKKEMGQSLVECITKKRIEAGIELMNTTDLKVYEIADKIGFRDSHYFSICFKKQTGITVKEFRTK